MGHFIGNNKENFSIFQELERKKCESKFEATSAARHIVSIPDMRFGVSQIVEIFLFTNFSSFLLAAFVTVDHFQVSEVCLPSCLK